MMMSFSSANTLTPLWSWGGARSDTREDPTLASLAMEWITEGSGATKSIEYRAKYAPN